MQYLQQTDSAGLSSHYCHIESDKQTVKSCWRAATIKAYKKTFPACLCFYFGPYLSRFIILNSSSTPLSSSLPSEVKPLHDNPFSLLPVLPHLSSLDSFGSKRLVCGQSKAIRRYRRQSKWAFTRTYFYWTVWSAKLRTEQLQNFFPLILGEHHGCSRLWKTARGIWLHTLPSLRQNLRLPWVARKDRKSGLAWLVQPQIGPAP